MKSMNTIKKYIAKGIVCCGMATALAPVFTSCKEDIDESNLYTFTGETIEDYLVNRSERFSSFNYILSRIGYDKILAAYGTYTCFAPTNEAIDVYLDSLYNDPVNTEVPHNGLTAPGIEGLSPDNPKSDSLCRDIALFHLLNMKVMGVNMGDGLTIQTLLGRDITSTIDPETGALLISRYSKVISMDNELENGVLHEIDCVIRRSNNLIAGEMNSHPEYTIFSQALQRTGLADTLVKVKTTDFDVVSNKRKFYVPEVCQQGYTVFAETDEALAAHGIYSIDDLKAYADSVYAHCADQGSGWYDYARNHHIEISTGNDFRNPWNTLSMFVRYHILEFKAAYDKLIYPTTNEVSSVTRVEYYETMLPYTLLKITKDGSKLKLNRWVANSTLTDQVAKLGSAAMHTVLFDGIEMVDAKSQLPALNGYIHPIKGMLSYEKFVPQGSLNERIRMDDTTLFGEMISNNFRGMSEDNIKAMDGGDGGNDGRHAGEHFIRIPPRFFKNIVFYNGDDTRLYYLPGYNRSWSNYQENEFLAMGQYDFALRLPPVPDGTYEIRIGYTAEDPQRGMLQFYLGNSSELSSMVALDIPLDMRHISLTNGFSAMIDGIETDVINGWCDWTKTEDQGLETDVAMRNLGYMRGPLYYTVGRGSGNYARNNSKDLRRIITKQELKQGEYWLRAKSVIENDKGEFHLDYIEFCPENVYNNTRYLEDMF